MDDTEAMLLDLHTNLIEFFTKHKPENIDEDVLTILMQFFIDSGGASLNRKLKKKYGEDLNNFKRLPSKRAPVMSEAIDERNLSKLKRASLSVDIGVDLKPIDKRETTANARNSKKIKPANGNDLRAKRKKKKKINDPELNRYKQGLEEQRLKDEGDIDDILFKEPPPPPSPEESDHLALSLLDFPKHPALEPRDLIEAFYSKHDSEKLSREAGVEKFVIWVQQHSLEELSAKLRKKYGEGLESMEKLARRRKNLEAALTEFYLKHDRPKLETRWTIMQILNWAMDNGLVALNEKFMVRYGYSVIDMELDI